LAKNSYANLVAGRNPVWLRSRRLCSGKINRPCMKDDEHRQYPATGNQGTPSWLSAPPLPKN
jgi:hypothetical protein